MEPTFFTDPTAFLDAAGPHLTANPVLGSVIATTTDRTVRELAAGIDSWAGVEAGFQRWWAVVHDSAGDVVGVAMRTAPFAPHPLFVLPMPEAAARALGAALHERGEDVGGVNGALPAAGLVAEEIAARSGAVATLEKPTRLWEATAVTVPPAPEGRLRRAREEDAALVLEWFTAFHAEADEQAGREPDPASGEHNTLDSVLGRIRDGVEWLWEGPGGDVQHLSGSSLPAFGVSRIGPVFTPREHRGRGLASYVVGELTRRGLADGTRMCLFTDSANPVSNGVYARLGYVPVAETGEYVLAPMR